MNWNAERLGASVYVCECEWMRFDGKFLKSSLDERVQQINQTVKWMSKEFRKRNRQPADRPSDRGRNFLFFYYSIHIE